MILTAIAVSVLSGCTGYSSSNSARMGDYTVIISDSGSECFVRTYRWNGDPDNTVIDIPDNYSDNTIVAQLGGFTGTGVPNPFSIEGPDDLVVWNTGDLDKYDVPVYQDDIVFTLKMGRNIKKFYTNIYSKDAVDPYMHIGVEQDDGSIIFYRVLINVECSDDNPAFYSKDGKLYSRKDDSLEHLPYPGEESNNAQETDNEQENEF